MIVISIVVTVLCLGLIVVLSSQVELFRDMRQMREVTGLLDQPVELDLGVAVGASLESLGQRNFKHATLILILSDKCATCRSLAAALDGAVPPHVQVILHGPGGGESELARLWHLDRAIEDPESSLANALGINTVPSAVLMEDGRLARGLTVPSVRQLHLLMEQARSAKRAEV